MEVPDVRTVCRDLQRKGERRARVSPGVQQPPISLPLPLAQINNLFGTANDHTEHKIEHDEKKGTTNVTGINPSECEGTLMTGAINA